MNDNNITNSSDSTVPTEGWPTDEEYELQQRIAELEKQIENYQPPKEVDYLQIFKKCLQSCFSFLKKDTQFQI